LFEAHVGREFNRFLAQALICAEQGMSEVKGVLTQVLKDLAEDEPKKPVLELPSA
jgi:hypothetical protein